MFPRTLLYALAVMLASIVASPQATPPAAVNGEMPDIPAAGEQRANTWLLGGVSVGTQYDDTSVFTGAGRTGAFNYRVQSDLQLQHLARRLDWKLNFSPGFVQNQRLPSLSTFTELAGFNLDYRPSSRLDLRLSDHYQITTNPFEHLDEDMFRSGFNPLNRPNETAVTPASKRTSNLADLATRYRLGPHTSVGVDAVYTTTRFRDLGGKPDSGLIDSRVGVADSFLAWRLSRKQSVGVFYRFQNMSFQGGGDARNVSHAVYVSDSWALTPRATLTFFAGPEYSQTRDQVFVAFSLGPFVLHLKKHTRQESWSPTGGATFSWEGQRNEMRASFVRRVSDGGGLLGAVRLQEVLAQFRRRFSPNWSMVVILDFANSQILGSGQPSGITGFHSLSANLAVTRRLADNLFLQFSYGRLQASSGSQLLGRQLDARNLAQVGLSYHFARPLGR